MRDAATGMTTTCRPCERWPRGSARTLATTQLARWRRCAGSVHRPAKRNVLDSTGRDSLGASTARNSPSLNITSSHSGELGLRSALRRTSLVNPCADYAACGLCCVACKNCPRHADLSRHYILRASEYLGHGGARPWAGIILQGKSGLRSPRTTYTMS